MTKTLPIVIVALPIIFAITHANAATCAAGQYLGTDGKTCNTCDIGYYCPGDDKRHYCSCYSADATANPPCYSDTAGATECTLCPEITDPAIPQPTHYWYWISEDATENKIHTRINGCRATWKLPTEHGIISFSCSYSSVGYEKGGSNTKCLLSTSASSCNAGYAIDRNASYFYTTSATSNIWFYNYNVFANNDFCEPAGIGKYSPAGSRNATACPAGTSTHTTTAESVDECHALCDAGITKLSTGDASFNIWPTADSQHSLVIEYNNKQCRVNLERGTKPGAINVQLPDGVYHTVN